MATLTPIEYNPFEKKEDTDRSIPVNQENNTRLTPIEYNPFVQSDVNKLTPVDHNPFDETTVDKSNDVAPTNRLNPYFQIPENSFINPESNVTVAEERNIISDMLSNLGRGVADLSRKTGYALETAGLESIGKPFREVGEVVLEKSDFLKPDVSEVAGEGFIKRGIMGGLRSIPASLAPTLGGAIVGTAVAGPIGGLVGGTLGTLGLFGLGTYGEKHQEYIEAGLSEKEAHIGALKQAAIEGGIEGVMSLVGLKIFGVDKLIVQPIKSTVKELLETPVKEFVKRLSLDMFGEVATEMLQSGLSEQVETGLGLKPEGAWKEGVVESIIPAMTMSLIFGSSTQLYNKAQTKVLKESLNSEDIETRIKAANTIANGIEDEELKNAWIEMSNDMISNNKNIPLMQDFVDYAQMGEEGRAKILQAANKNNQNFEIDRLYDNITSYGQDMVQQAIEQLDNSLVETNSLLQNNEEIIKQAEELGISSDELTIGLKEQIDKTNQLRDRLVDYSSETSTFKNEQQVPELEIKTEPEPGGGELNEYSLSDGTPVGYTVVRPDNMFQAASRRMYDAVGENDQVLRLQEILVEPEMQGKKFGTQLLTEVFNKYPDAWIGNSQLGLGETKEAAIKALENVPGIEIHWDREKGGHFVARVNKTENQTVEQQISRDNINLDPSEKQKEAGNYKKASVKIDDLKLKIENPAGSERSGRDEDGNEWSSEMKSHYGYFERTEGKDGDQVDAFIKPGTSSSPQIFIVDQVNPKTGKFDEHKVILGATSVQEAQEIYLSNYEDGWQGLGNITEMDQTEFKDWLGDSKRTKKPAFDPELQIRQNETPGQGVSREELRKMFPGQDVTFGENGKMSVRFKNGQGLTIDTIQNAGKDFIEFAIRTGQMSKDGRILGVTLGNKILIDKDFADSKTGWHENMHVLENLGMIRKGDIDLLNKEFNKLREANQLGFPLSTHKDPIQRVKEDRANLFAKIMTERENYRNTPFNAMIQRVMDFFNNLYVMGQRYLGGNKDFQTVSSLAREVESGKIYERIAEKGKTVNQIPELETPANRWYSTLERGIENISQKKAPASQWKGMIKKIPELKQDELDWVGLNQWLDSKEGSVSKEDILNFVRENNVQVEEVLHRSKEDIDQEIISLNNEIDFIDRKIMNILYSKGFLNNEMNDLMNDSDRRSKIDKLSKIIPEIDWKDYLKKLDKINELNKKYTDGGIAVYGPKDYPSYSIPGGYNYRELLLTIPMKDGSSYIGNHWNEPNVLVHVRFNERVGQNGESILFIEEVQSDWHQEGRKKGYKQKVNDLNNIINNSILTELENEYNKTESDSIWNSYEKELQRVTNELNNKIPKQYHFMKGVNDWLVLDKSAGQGGMQISAGKTPQEAWDLISPNKKIKLVPEAPFKKSDQWLMLAMKRMVRYAAENEFAQIAFTPGQVHTNRYGTNRIIWRKRNGSFYLDIDENTNFDDSNTLEGIQINSKEELFDLLKTTLSEDQDPKSITDKLWTRMQNEPSGISEPRKEGLEGFYDKILPQALNKFFNKSKWGKAKVSKTDLGNVGSAWTLQITPEMRDKAIREGMPQFEHKEKTNTNTAKFWNWYGDSKWVNKDNDPIVFYHGTNTPFSIFDPEKAGSNTGRHAGGLGFYFNFSQEKASTYGDILMPVYLKMEKPYEMSIKEISSFNSLEEAKAFKEDLRSKGYDGIYVYDKAVMADGGLSGAYFIIFDNKNVKSIYNMGEWNPANPDIYLQVQESLPEQKIPDETYIDVHKQKKNLLGKILQSTRMRASEVKLMADKSLTPISTRLKKIDKDLASQMRWLDFRTAMKINSALKEAHPIMKRMKRKDVSKEDRTAWDWARKNSDQGKIIQLARKYGFEENYNNLRTVLDQLRQDAKDVGYDIGYIEDYWPRIIKDQEGFLQATQGISRRPEFTEALKERADKLNISVSEFRERYPDTAADIISNLILGRNTGIGGPGNIQARKFETIPVEYADFYMDSDAALMQYIYSMTKKIEARRFFGKVPEKISKIKKNRAINQTKLVKLEQQSALLSSESSLSVEQQKLLDTQKEQMKTLRKTIKDYDARLEKYKLQRDYTENIGAYINDLIIQGKLNKADEKSLRELLDARFHERGTTGIVHAYKNLAYIDVMGSPISALTQIGDLAWAMYVGKAWTPKGFADTTKNIVRSLFNKSGITKKDLGIDRMAQEFADFDSLSKAVSKVFKAVGLEKMDSIGKETLINNAFSYYKRQVQSEVGRKQLLEQIRPIFGKESNNVINDLLANNPSDNVKMLLYSRLLDFQPVSLSEMPEYYLNGGNWRILYMLKTYTIKQLDVFRNEVYRKFKDGDATQKVEALGNMVALMAVLSLANAGADEIKDFLLGRETKLEDNVIENLLTIGGANRFVRMQARREGIGTAISQLALPPFRFINSLGKDIYTKDLFDPREARSIESIPLVGKLAYWNVGRGSNYRPSINEQDFNEAGKTFRKFKKDFEESKDKHSFLQKNKEQFIQMKTYENFNSSIRKISALINKLEKLDQTTNIRKRIGRLEAQQEKFRKRYFEVINK
ncbi:MAG: hypothetical protein SVO01_00125 [Thermotogota bacterium]|nr:hypothetical protein [Thermotogota bacterium]